MTVAVVVDCVGALLLCTNRASAGCLILYALFLHGCHHAHFNHDNAHHHHHHDHHHHHTTIQEGI
jgi:hypothetical protein